MHAGAHAIPGLHSDLRRAVPCSVGDNHALHHAVFGFGIGTQADIEAEPEGFRGVAMKQDLTTPDGWVESNVTTPRSGNISQNFPVCLGPNGVSRFREMASPLSSDANARYQPFLRFRLHIESEPVIQIRLGNRLRFRHHRKVIPFRASVLQQRKHDGHQDTESGECRKIRFDGTPELAQLDFLPWTGSVQGERVVAVAGGCPANHKPITAHDLQQGAAA